MRATKNDTGNLSDMKTFPISILMRYLGCGRTTAEKIGVAAGARLAVGRRVLYRRDRIDAYIDSIDTEKV